MKHSMIAAVTVGVLLTIGVSFAQEGDAAQMPETVRKALAWRIGAWEYAIVGEDIKAKLVYRWAPGQTCVIGDIHGTEAGNSFYSSHTIGWDGVSENGTHTNMVSTAPYIQRRGEDLDREGDYAR